MRYHCRSGSAYRGGRSLLSGSRVDTEDCAPEFTGHGRHLLPVDVQITSWCRDISSYFRNNDGVRVACGRPARSKVNNWALRSKVVLARKSNPKAVLDLLGKSRVIGVLARVVKPVTKYIILNSRERGSRKEAGHVEQLGSEPDRPTQRLSGLSL